MSRLTLSAVALFALAALTISAESTAMAQDGGPSEPVPTFAAAAVEAEPDVVEAATPSRASVRLKPVAISEEALGTAVPAGGFASVIPPAPRIVSRVASRPVGATAHALNSGFGVRRDPIHGGARMHTGIDIRASFGESVGAALGGRVAYAGYRGGYGNLVVVDHGHGITTYYAHLHSIAVAVGQRVLAGEAVGLAGSTGRSTGPHLHFEVRAHDVPVDPSSMLSFKAGRVLVDGKPLRGRPIDGGDEEQAPARGAKAAKEAEPPRPQLPLFQSGDTLSNY